MIKKLELPETSDVKIRPSRRMSEAQFVEWCDDKTWAEWVDGEVNLISPVSFEHDDLFSYLLRLIGTYVEHHDAGVALTEPMHIRFATQRRRRSPDIFFISEARREIIRPNHIEGAPDLIMEIVSPNNPAVDWRDKYLEYERAGVREYWVVDPASRVVEAYTLTRQKKYQRLTERDEKIKSKVLKGFYLKAAWLFAEKRPKTLAILRELGVK